MLQQSQSSLFAGVRLYKVEPASILTLRGKTGPIPIPS